MFMIRAPFRRTIGTDFSGVLESVGSGLDELRNG
jgi:hypothetical protein